MLLDDLGDVLTIEQQCHSHPWSQAQFQSSIDSAHACWVVENDNGIIAYAITSTVLGEAELLNIAVTPQWQGQGIAKAFLKALCDSFTNTIESFFLEVRASNFSAIGLYETLDFNEVGRRPNYYPANSGREDALIMAKQLMGF